MSYQISYPFLSTRFYTIYALFAPRRANFLQHKIAFFAIQKTRKNTTSLQETAFHIYADYFSAWFNFVAGVAKMAFSLVFSFF